MQLHPTKALAPQEMQALLMALIAGSAPEGVAEETMAALVDWAIQVRADQAVLKLLLSGKVVVRYVNDDWEYRLATPEETAQVKAAGAAENVGGE